MKRSWLSRLFGPRWTAEEAVVHVAKECFGINGELLRSGVRAIFQSVPGIKAIRLEFNKDALPPIPQFRERRGVAGSIWTGPRLK